MKVANSKEEVLEIIDSNVMAVVYFSGEKCGACSVIKRKIERILKNYDKIKSVEIDGEKNIEVAASYGVFSLPIFLLFIEGKETIRIGRNVNLLELQENIKRYYSMLF